MSNVVSGFIDSVHSLRSLDPVERAAVCAAFNAAIESLDQAEQNAGKNQPARTSRKAS